MIACFGCWVKTVGALAAGLFGLGILVTIHELGHFIFARLSGTQVPTFSIGMMGPTLFKKKWGETEFIVTAIPFGGYVEVAGLAEPGQGEQKHAHDTGSGSFANKSLIWQLFIILGGVLFNFILAYMIFVGLHTVGMPKSALINPDTTPVIISQIVPGSGAAQAQLQSGDKITRIDQVSSPSITTFLDALQGHKGQAVSLSIIRDDQQLEKTVSVDANGKIGMGFADSVERAPGVSLILALSRAWGSLIEICSRTFSIIVQLFKKHSMNNVGGPIMMIAQGGASARQGFVSYLLLLALISVGLALFNLIPLPITDGGWAVILAIEAIARRSIPLGIKMALYRGTWLLMIALFLYISAHDLVLLFGAKLSALWNSARNLVR